MCLHYPAFEPTGELYAFGHELIQAGFFTKDLLYELSRCKPDVPVLKLLLDHLLKPHLKYNEGTISIPGVSSSLHRLCEEEITQHHFQNESQATLIQHLQNELERGKQDMANLQQKMTALRSDQPVSMPPAAKTSLHADIPCRAELPSLRFDAGRLRRSLFLNILGQNLLQPHLTLQALAEEGR